MWVHGGETMARRRRAGQILSIGSIGVAVLCVVLVVSAAGLTKGAHAAPPAASTPSQVTPQHSAPVEGAVTPSPTVGAASPTPAAVGAVTVTSPGQLPPTGGGGGGTGGTPILPLLVALAMVACGAGLVVRRRGA